MSVQLSGAELISWGSNQPTLRCRAWGLESISAKYCHNLEQKWETYLNILSGDLQN